MHAAGRISEPTPPPEVIAATPNVNNGAPPANNGGYTYTNVQLYSDWDTNKASAFWHPSTFGSAYTNTSISTRVRYTTIGLNILGGGLVGAGAGLAYAGYLGASAATTWGFFSANAIAGATGSLFTDAATQLERNQPFSPTELVEQTAMGAGTGVLVGGVFKVAGIGLKAISGLVSDGISSLIGSEATGVVQNTAADGLASGGYAGRGLSQAEIDELTSEFRAAGGEVDQSVDAQRYLNMRGAGGLTLNSKLILLPAAPTRTAVMEELLHAAQFAQGAAAGVNGVLELEADAAEQLIANRLLYNLENDEVRQVVNNLRNIRIVLNR